MIFMKLKYILSFLLLAVLLPACEDFLKEEPKDEFSVDQYFSDPDHAYSAVNGLYRSGAPAMYEGGVYSGTPMMFVQYMSGLFDNEYRGQEIQIQRAQQLTLDGLNTAGYIDNIWFDLYEGISRANNAIANIPTTPDLSPEQQNQLLGEARFFRALSYFHLVRMFGPVPLETEPVTSLDDIYSERSPIEAVYSLIEEDLRFALEQAGLSTSHMSENESRITQGAVAVLLADVYLTMAGFPLQQTERYADAATIARNLINGEYGAYALEQHGPDPATSAYNKMRTSDVSPEYIYYREYMSGISNSPYPPWSYPVALVKYTQYAITNGAYQPEPELLWAYDPDADLRMQNKQFFHWTLDAPEGEVTFPPTPYIWHDDASLFVGPPSSSKDAVIYSYSDALLIAAEAIAQSEGVTAEAINYLAQVRGRAYWQVGVAGIEATLTGLSAPEFVEEVWTERLRELVFEFRTWFDIQRTRKYPVTDEANQGEVTYVDVVGHTNPLGSTYEEKHLLFPLSQNEIQRNPSLGGNNPGY
jgi:starch-binding outer membrane protein, SusD/RagB family